MAVERASSSNDAFGLLGLPAQFDLDPQVIERAFFDKTKELHPDRFANAPAAERVAALSRSRALNDAYQTLKKPVPRAEYLLARAGVTIGDNERLDPEFLMQILELREELAEARVAKRTAQIEKLCGDEYAVAAAINATAPKTRTAARCMAVPFVCEALYGRPPRARRPENPARPA